MWPSCRRSGYEAIRKTGPYSKNIDVHGVFYKWTIEGYGSCYREVNQALLDDDQPALQKHANYINDLCMAIKQNRALESITVYRGIQLQQHHVNAICEGMSFLWPTFTSTSRDFNIAHAFGSWVFEITTEPNDGTYHVDISNHSYFEGEQEVLFYPYSGFRVKGINKSSHIVQLKCCDTCTVESPTADFLSKLTDGSVPCAIV